LEVDKYIFLELYDRTEISITLSNTYSSHLER